MLPAVAAAHDAERRAHAWQRTRVEHGISHLKNWRALTRHLGRREHLDTMLPAVAGLVSSQGRAPRPGQLHRPPRALGGPPHHPAGGGGFRAGPGRHVVDVPPEVYAPVPLHVHAPDRTGTDYVLRVPAIDDSRLAVGMVLTQESSSRARSGAGPGGLVAADFSADDLGRWRHRWISDEMRPVESRDRLLGTFDVDRIHRFDAGMSEVDVPLRVTADATSRCC